MTECQECHEPHATALGAAMCCDPAAFNPDDEEE